VGAIVGGVPGCVGVLCCVEQVTVCLSGEVVWASQHVTNPNTAGVYAGYCQVQDMCLRLMAAVTQ
jgi:hypothetical protein